MSVYLNIIEIIVSIALMVFILVQSKGAGFSGTFTNENSIFRTRRGVEKTLFQFTLILSGLFILISVISVLIPGRVG